MFKKSIWANFMHFFLHVYPQNIFMSHSPIGPEIILPFINPWLTNFRYHTFWSYFIVFYYTSLEYRTSRLASKVANRTIQEEKEPLLTIFSHVLDKPSLEMLISLISLSKSTICTHRILIANITKFFWKVLLNYSILLPFCGDNWPGKTWWHPNWKIRKYYYISQRQIWRKWERSCKVNVEKTAAVKLLFRNHPGLKTVNYLNILGFIWRRIHREGSKN